MSLTSWCLPFFRKYYLKGQKNLNVRNFRQLASSVKNRRTGLSTSTSFQSNNHGGVPLILFSEPATASAEDIISAATAAQQQFRSLFPWRHEPAENPIPRLAVGTMEFQNQILLPSKGQALIACFFLNMPLWQIFFLYKHWRNDLADACGWAFAQGVSGILSNVYSLDENADSDGKVDFTFPKVKSCDEMESGSVVDASSSNNETEEDNQKTESPKKADPSLEMFSRPLRNLYQSAHEHGKEHLQIRLQSEPVRAALYSIFCFPYISRAAFESNPTLKDYMRKLITLVKSNPMEFFSHMQTYIGEQLEKNNKLETTVEIQVLIECNEIFQVIDRETGIVVQGSEDGAIRKVLHVVRFETTVTTKQQETFPYATLNQVGNWQITDIDDLLGTTTWYYV